MRPQPKRVLDLVLGSVLLVLAGLPLIGGLVATALRRPRGGVVVRETVTGLGGRPFTLYTLNTRRCRLDLLSWLPHVLRGQMSLVGPAPLPPGTPGAELGWRRHMRPGLTGLAQIRRGSALPWDEPLLLDQHYVEHHWMGLDVALLLRTPATLRTVPGQAHLSDADHRLRGYSAAE
ncbi:sugar transferase [Streptomyces sp. SP18CS02]|uniref:sugar transferase n=1 Tax=Streptomyces sp. SP18CS02 TaxID=3002531 RepID=UPI002E79E367|nr:sugar transferase [Streptomyces sp. SP18CS02]MEE1753521.1 sugar transferase [Streptomyces sp. SP18CS02]